MSVHVPGIRLVSVLFLSHTVTSITIMKNNKQGKKIKAKNNNNNNNNISSDMIKRFNSHLVLLKFPVE